MPVNKSGFFGDSCELEHKESLGLIGVRRPVARRAVRDGLLRMAQRGTAYEAMLHPDSAKGRWRAVLFSEVRAKSGGGKR